MHLTVLPAALIVALLAFPDAAGAQDRKSRLCRVNNAVSNTSQLDGRLGDCKDGDIALVSVVIQSVALEEVAARVCDFTATVLLEESTEAPGVGRVTCLYPGSVRSRTR